MTEERGGQGTKLQPKNKQRGGREQLDSDFCRAAANVDHLRNLEYHLQAVLVLWGEKHGNEPPLKTVVFLSMFFKNFHLEWGGGGGVGRVVRGRSGVV